MDLLEALADQLEGFTEALLEGRLELLVDGPPHLLELGFVLLLQVVEPALERVPDEPELCRKRLALAVETDAELAKSRLLALDRGLEMVLDRLLEIAERLPQIRAGLRGVVVQFTPDRHEPLVDRIPEDL